MKKLKIKISKTGFGDEILFKINNVHGAVHKNDGSGYLMVEDKKYQALGGYCCESGLHKHRFDDIKRLAKFYTQAHKDLLSINRELKKIGLK